jgi:hypothetical protein
MKLQVLKLNSNITRKKRKEKKGFTQEYIDEIYRDVYKEVYNNDM